MEPVFTFIVIVLSILAVLGIIVGVANDAVNFLNSALGSKAAPYKIIMAIAAAGILVGTLTSSGMMEVARSGVFYPAQFSFPQIMTLFLGMMLGNIILLDLFNTLGMPTSTTVSLVFGLLGAAVAVAVYKIAGDPAYSLTDLSQFINSDKAIVIISAILLSVALSFIFGIGFMYISRLLFSFRYHKMFSRLGAVWCGISFTGIIYFVLFKGLKSSGLIPEIWISRIHSDPLLSLLAIWIVSSLILLVLQLMKINILKTTILAGTFSLALSFAGNDLVNFIGVPLAGLDSYMMARQAGDPAMMMDGLMQPARANLWMLGLAGVIMVLTLFFNKKSRQVTETELALSNQNETDERFGSTMVSRQLVRAALRTSGWIARFTPAKIKQAIDRQFKPLPATERGNAMYDLIRAAVNLTAASILISLATSLQLPLSTTYVVFMVAMGSSLADRAWGRESAVYRITGVMAVITGWFITALAGFAIAFMITLFLIWGGTAAVLITVTICAWLFIRSNFKTKKKKQSAQEEKNNPLEGKNASEVLYDCTEEVCATMEAITRIYDRTLIAVFKENRKVLKEMVAESGELFYQARTRKYEVLPTLRKLETCDIDTGHFYVQITDYLSEVTKALIHITRPAFEHIDNNHEGLSKEQIMDLMEVNDQVKRIFGKINDMLRSKDFTRLEQVLRMRDTLFDTIARVLKNQLRRINENSNSTKASILYLNILNETKTMILQARNLLKSQRYFLEHEPVTAGQLKFSETPHKNSIPLNRVVLETSETPLK